MKGYENASRHHLTRRMATIIRIDGKAFHTFTKGMNKPFDNVLVEIMQTTMKYLCENIQGCVLGYTQSDEITLVLVDYQKLTSDAWFDNNIQKIVSVSASMATLAFNKYWSWVKSDADRCLCHCKYRYEDEYEGAGLYYESAWDEYKTDWIEEWGFSETITKEEAIIYWENICQKDFKAMFDSRVFSIPKEEVVNCLLWQQQDATRNSIEAVGQANFSHKELHKKSCNEIQDMLVLQKGIDWNDIHTHLKRGSCCVRTIDSETSRSKWVIDSEIPIFNQDRDYIEKLI